MPSLTAFCFPAGSSRRGSVTVMFAGMAIPLVIAAGLAVDYSFYVQAQSQLVTAADAGALHAVRIAAADFVAGQTVAQSVAAGTAAGRQWWDAQVGNISDANVPEANVIVPAVQYNASNGTFTETISYQGTVNTHVAGHVTNITSWPIQGSSTASITANSYAGFYFLIDNSSSMLIGATPADITKIEALTICSPTATAIGAAQNMTNYAWTYPAPYGYGEYETTPGNPNTWTDQTIPTPLPAGQQLGSCASNFSGSAAQCPYAPNVTQYGSSATVVDAAGFCPTGTGVPDGFVNPGGNTVPPRIDRVTQKTANLPQAPCGFACHTNDGVHDYYTLARQSGQGIMLRFDVIQQAAANVMNLLIARQQNTQITNQFAVGVYQFNSSVTQVHPASGNTFVEADSNLTGAQTDITNITTPVVGDGPNTNFPTAVNYLASNLQPAGSGGTPSTRTKNMFIITDGLEDDQNSGRFVGPMTADPPAAETYCSKLKALGYNLYVLYTPYYPLANPFYLRTDPYGAINYVEPTVPPATTNPMVAALKACASSPNQFYEASDSADINTALQSAVQSALASPGRLTN